MHSDELFNALRWLTETGEAFVAGVRAKLDESAEWIFAGRCGQFLAADQSARLKDLLANAAVFEHEVAVRTPANPALRCDLTGGWLGLPGRRRARVVLVVAVDLGEVARRAAAAAGGAAAAGDWPALSAEAFEWALHDYCEPGRRMFIGVCSPSGFAGEAVELARRRHLSLSARGGGLVLVTPRADGGWTVRTPEVAGVRDHATGIRDHGPEQKGAAVSDAPTWHFVFDPESFGDKIERVRSAIEASGNRLGERGLRDRELAARLHVPLDLVRQVFAAEAGRRPDLRVRQLDGEHVLLGPADFSVRPEERMGSMFQKLRDLLSRKGQETRKIELLADKRALLAARRDRLYGELDELGGREQAIKASGIASDSPATQRRLAGELAQVRRRIEQGDALASLLNRQIDVLSTHIHHLTMLTQGQDIQMPDVEEMTRDAVRAEELIERVKADAELAESLADATGSAAGAGSKVEEDILAEFAAARGKQAQSEQAGGESAGPSARSEPAGPPARNAPVEPPAQPQKHSDQPLKE